MDAIEDTKMIHDSKKDHSTKKIREKSVEKKLCEAVKHSGGLALKFVSPGCAGVPDRLVLLTKGRFAFAEIKAPGQKLRPLQVKRKRQLESLGFRVYCIDSPEQIPKVIRQIGGDAQ